jgi:hypothetical protein
MGGGGGGVQGQKLLSSPLLIQSCHLGLPFLFRKWWLEESLSFCPFEPQSDRCIVKVKLLSVSVWVESGIGILPQENLVPVMFAKLTLSDL